MALFARVCVRVHSRVPAPTFPPPLYTGGWKWAGVRLGGRVCVCLCVCVCVCVNGGDGGRGRREGKFYLLQGISQGGCSPSFPGIFYLLQGISPGCFLVCVCARPITHPNFPPYIYGGGNGHLGACARACARMRMRMRMRMREGGCLSCCGLYTPPQPPAPPRCPLDVEKCKIFDLRGLFLCGGKIYHPLHKDAGEGKRMGK